MRPLLLLLAVAALTLAASPIPAPPPEPHPLLAPAFPAPRVRKDAADEAVARGLEYLRTSQNKNGSWGNPAANAWGGGFGRPQVQPAANTGDLAITALSVMAFLSAGHVPGEGHYGTVVERGIDWVLAQQQLDGKLVPPNMPIEMYHHGICTLMLAEVVGMTPPDSDDRARAGQGKTADRLRAALEKAVKVILAGQRKGDGRGWANFSGGWRYQVMTNGQFGGDADLSVTGWQLMALRAAKNVGCDVPADRIKAAVEYVKRSYDSATGGFKYQPGGNQITIPCTGVGVLCLELSGKEYHLCDEALGGGGYLNKKDHQLRAGDAHMFYGVYYVSQAMFQLGGNYWESYRDKLHDLLLNQARPGADGGWGGAGGGDGAVYGSSYATAMAVLALTVEYRFLPIYQRFEEPLERDGRE